MMEHRRKNDYEGIREQEAPRSPEEIMEEISRLPSLEELAREAEELREAVVRNDELARENVRLQKENERLRASGQEISQETLELVSQNGLELAERVKAKLLQTIVDQARETIEKVSKEAVDKFRKMQPLFEKIFQKLKLEVPDYDWEKLEISRNISTVAEKLELLQAPDKLFKKPEIPDFGERLAQARDKKVAVSIYFKGVERIYQGHLEELSKAVSQILELNNNPEILDEKIESIIQKGILLLTDVFDNNAETQKLTAERRQEIEELLQELFREVKLYQMEIKVEGDKFNALYHDLITPFDKRAGLADELITEIGRRGFFYQNRILRKARVRINKT